MKFNKEEVALLENVIDYHCDIILNDEDDHGVSHVHNLYEVSKTYEKKEK